MRVILDDIKQKATKAISTTPAMQSPRFSAKAVCLIAALLCAANGLAWGEPVTIRFSHVVGENTPKGIGARLIKERVEQQLPGEVRVEIYPNSQRYTDEQVFIALLMGDVEMAAPSLAKFRSVSRELQVFDLPFLFSSMEAVHRFQASSTGQALLNNMSARGIKGLAYWDNGMRVISADRPIQTPADVENLTFRIEPSDVIEAQYAALQATSLRLPFKHVPEALDRGLVDGQENSWSNIASKRIYEVQSHFTETNHSYQGYMVITSTKFWDGLPVEIRDRLEAILAEVSTEVRRLAVAKNLEGQQTVRSSASHIIGLTPEQRDTWREQLQPVWRKFKDGIGTDIIFAAVAAGRTEAEAP